MAVYLFTIHAYRSWNADNPRGYVRRGEGILPADAGMAKAYDQAASELPVIFGLDEQQVLLWIAHDCCCRRNWRLHTITFESTHLHAVVSWIDQTEQTKVFQKIKNLMSRELNLRTEAKRKHWLSGGGSRQRVKDRAHFEHLVNIYLPKHRGLFWKEGDQPPQPPTSVGG